MMKTRCTRLCWFILLLLVVSACCATAQKEFGIYLLRGEMPTVQFQASDLDALELQDEPIIGIVDIVSYSQATHEMELTAEAYERVQKLFSMPVDVDGLPFVVRVGRERIYRGAFWTPASSLIFEGVIIMQPFATDRHTVALSLGYPAPEAFSGTDPRSDARILESLEKSGKLK
jgi:hypothetical protein